MTGRDVGRLAVAVALPLAVGFLAGRVTAPAVVSWYPGLERPGFTPPSWVFAPVWTFLYVTMGVAAWLVWRRGLGAPGVPVALAAFLVQLALNGLWSLLFFGLRSPLAGLVDIAALWAALAVCTALFFRASAVAGWLMVPYLGWVTYAGVLNASIWALNR
ncbi:MAG TPA: TspO/MBR family protein [Gemmatimonadota bacterium]|nr:TspO/MBR family protein [Gemmatimonadota bacterium]